MTGGNAWYWRLLVNRWLGWLLLLPLALLILLTALQYDRIEANEHAGEQPTGSLLVADKSVANQRILNDFDAFYVVGRLYWDGDILAAYDNDYLLAAQRRFTGTQTFMPWAYPPQLTALVPILPVIGMGWSYLLFMAGTLALYFAALTRFGGPYAGASLLAIYPALLLNTRLGQNGFLTAALIGLFLLGFRACRASAGVPLGLMVFKPHLGIAMGLLALLNQRWRVLAIAVAVVLLTSIGATLALGIAVWPAFMQGVGAAGGFLEVGAFPLYRMSSVYAGFRSFEWPFVLAMTMHVIGAAAALGLMVFAHVNRWAVNRQLAVAAAATVFVSPYNYDYDFACLAFALALLLPELIERMRFRELIAFYACAWIGSGAGLAQHLRAVLITGTTAHPHGSSLNWSFQAAGIIAAGVIAAVVLRRPAAATAQSAGAQRISVGI